MSGPVKNHPSKVQFDELKAQLSSIYGQAYLECDGYLVSASVVQDKMSLKIAIYVNGFIKGKNYWHGKDTELDAMPDIARKFYHLSCRSVYNAKQIKQLEKACGKKRAKEKGVYAKCCYCTPWFSTATSFLAHIKKHNDSIRVLTYAEYKQLLDSKQEPPPEEESYEIIHLKTSAK